MHFREVNNKLKQLKANVFWTKEALNNTVYHAPFYQELVNDFEKAQQDLESFRNTTIGQLKG